MSNTYTNTCKNCGEAFSVKRKSENDPNNYGKFKRCCSAQCTAALRSKYLLERRASGEVIRTASGQRRVLDRQILVELYCYRHLTIDQIAAELHAKQPTVSRALKEYEILKVFYNSCPNCGNTFTVSMRCQTDAASNKYKKFCSTGCFLSSRKHSDTWIERVVQGFLEDQRVEFIKQYPIGRMTTDFMLPLGNIIIEVNGDFWHANPDIYGNTKPLHKTHARAIEKDNRKLARLSELGYRVITVWENDLKTNIDGTLDELLRNINGRAA